MADLPTLPEIDVKRLGGGPELGKLWALLSPFLRDLRALLDGGLSLTRHLAAVVRGRDARLVVTSGGPAPFIETPQKVALVLVVAGELDTNGKETGQKLVVLPHWKTGSQGGQNGIHLTQLPGTTAGERYTLTVYAFTE